MLLTIRTIVNRGNIWEFQFWFFFIDHHIEKCLSLERFSFFHCPVLSFQCTLWLFSSNCYRCLITTLFQLIIFPSVLLQLRVTRQWTCKPHMYALRTYFFSLLQMMIYSVLKICIIMQIIHYMMSRDFIYPIIFKSYLNKNFMLFVNIYGFMRFLCNVFAWQAL